MSDELTQARAELARVSGDMTIQDLTKWLADVLDVAVETEDWALVEEVRDAIHDAHGSAWLRTVKAASPAALPARFREATAAVERVRDDMTTHPGAYRQVIDALTLLGRWLAADPEDPAGQAVARALASPTTEETRTDV